MTKDFLGQELFVGDKILLIVAMTSSGGKFKSATITKINPKTVVYKDNGHTSNVKAIKTVKINEILLNRAELFI